MQDIFRDPNFEQFHQQELKKHGLEHGDPTATAMVRAVEEKYGSVKQFGSIREFLVQHHFLRDYFKTMYDDIHVFAEQEKKEEFITNLPDMNSTVVKRSTKKILTMEQDFKHGGWSKQSYLDDSQGLYYYVSKKYKTPKTFAEIMRLHRGNAGVLRGNLNVQADVDWMEKTFLSAKKSTRKVCPQVDPSTFFTDHAPKPFKKTLKANRG